jgi:hypothetical protein
MQFMMLLHGDEAGYAAMSEKERGEVFEAFMAYNRELAEAGVLRGGSSLKPSPTGTVLRGADGKIVVTDGPFAESREQIGGYYILETASLDDATHWASKCPMVWAGAIELREIEVVPEELGQA